MVGSTFCAISESAFSHTPLSFQWWCFCFLIWFSDVNCLLKFVNSMTCLLLCYLIINIITWPGFLSIGFLMFCKIYDVLGSVSEHLFGWNIWLWICDALMKQHQIDQAMKFVIWKSGLVWSDELSINIWHMSCLADIVICDQQFHPHKMMRNLCFLMTSLTCGCLEDKKIK